MAPTPAQECEIERRGAVVITAAPGSDLHRWLRRGRTRAALVRPDGTVQRTAPDPAPLLDDLTPLRPLTAATQLSAAAVAAAPAAPEDPS